MSFLRFNKTSLPEGGPGGPMGMGPGGHMGGQGMMGPNGPGKHSSS